MKSQALPIKGLQGLKPFDQALIHRMVKRLFDLVFSAFLLGILIPLLVVIALAIRLSSPGKIFYSQPRLGRSGKIFNCYKFRTMHVDAEECLGRLLLGNPDLQKEWEKKQKLKDDPRVFPLGRWLRLSSLDELPQFWNVLKGDLSVVGPRPYMLTQKNQLGHLADKIMSVRPGITGLWQTSGRSRTTFERRIVLDAEYVDHRSFWYDLLLILKTIPEVFMFKKNAY